MPSRVITVQIYDALLQAYRANPGVYSVAARQVGVGVRMARRAWEAGWLPKHQYARPIRDVLAEDEIKARAEARRLEDVARRQQDEERERARKQATDALAQEQRILGLARGDIIQGLSALGTITPGLRKLVENLNATLNDPAVLKDIKPKQAVELVRNYAFAARALANAGELLIRAEREHGGDPRNVPGANVSAPSAEMGLEEAVRNVKEANSLIELARRCKVLPLPSAADADADGTPN